MKGLRSHGEAAAPVALETERIPLPLHPVSKERRGPAKRAPAACVVSLRVQSLFPPGGSSGNCRPNQ